ncbi:hypothetical protein N7457_004820 [Penicillium paradoxum]|uniref:uncharacterized protein n=1 Tax=Penicillium paradoxum TaxID=176176 RepID=UPI002546F1D0|nr:uncharacterized protein N7457_004820 [Penicillium paradoxum]KAJ5783046.1 hypothetical protein N7457_004820 [Penicillium paradoxum]
MSNFMHKVKEAMTGHHKDTSEAHDIRAHQDDHGSSNLCSTESNPDKYNSSSMNPSSGMSSNNPHGAGSTGMNAGPHDSKMANKMDPRVDSDMDHRAQYSGATNPQSSSNAPSNMTPHGQSPTQGVDNHMSSKDDYHKSTQENKSQSRTSDNYDGQWSSEQSHETSMQEHKSHSATSHAMPCQTDIQNELGLDNRAAGTRFGGNADGGSSNMMDAGQRSGARNADPMNKLDPRVARSNEQAGFADQRGGY